MNDNHAIHFKLPRHTSYSATGRKLQVNRLVGDTPSDHDSHKVPAAIHTTLDAPSPAK
jgi:hypothetical protein